MQYFNFPVTSIQRVWSCHDNIRNKSTVTARLKLFWCRCKLRQTQILWYLVINISILLTFQYLLLLFWETRYENLNLVLKLFFHFHISPKIILIIFLSPLWLQLSCKTKLSLRLHVLSRKAESWRIFKMHRKNRRHRLQWINFLKQGK